MLHSVNKILIVDTNVYCNICHISFVKDLRIIVTQTYKVLQNCSIICLLICLLNLNDVNTSNRDMLALCNLMYLLNLNDVNTSNRDMLALCNFLLYVW